MKYSAGRLLSAAVTASSTSECPLKTIFPVHAGENQQIINLSQHSPSARKYRSLPGSYRGQPLPAWEMVRASSPQLSALRASSGLPLGIGGQFFLGAAMWVSSSLQHCPGGSPLLLTQVSSSLGRSPSRLENKQFFELVVSLAVPQLHISKFIFSFHSNKLSSVLMARFW